MSLSNKSEKIIKQLAGETKLGNLRAIAKEIKKDHELALELWSSGKFLPRMLALLVMDSKALDQKVIQRLFDDIGQHALDERLQLADWLMANQLSKNKFSIALME